MARAAADGGAIEELFRMLLARYYEYILVDCGSQINSCTVAAPYTGDTIFLVGNPDALDS
jgi:MinD-like ATPase involved in chromosome partitioning or flagellar assembly